MFALRILSPNKRNIQLQIRAPSDALLQLRLQLIRLSFPTDHIAL